MGRSSKVQKAFVKAREAEAKRQNEIKIAESELQKISSAKTMSNLFYGSARHKMDTKSNFRASPSPEMYQYARLANNTRSRTPSMKWGNVAGNRIDWIPFSQWNALAGQSTASAQAKLNKLKAGPSKAISMQQANKMVGSSRTTQ